MLGALEGCEVADAVEDDQLCVRYAAGEIFGVLVFDEIFEFGLDDRDRHADRGEIVGGEVGLGSLHQADVFDE